MLGSLASRGERKKRSRVVREQFEKAAIFFVLCESNLNILKLVHKKQKMGSLFSICSTFYIQNNKKHVSLDSNFSSSCWFENQSHTMCTRWAVEVAFEIVIGTAEVRLKPGGDRNRTWVILHKQILLTRGGWVTQGTLKDRINRGNGYLLTLLTTNFFLFLLDTWFWF